jgi:NADPH:quinone reductase-like Zn-dependent oxidoreductase
LPDVLQLREVDKPIPWDNEVLVRIRAATVIMGDCELRNLKGPVLFQNAFRMYLGWRGTKRITILGQELAGEIEATGMEAKRFRKGIHF